MGSLGKESDLEVRTELKFCGGMLDLRQFDKIFVSVSGGKDSHAMLWLVKELAEKQGGGSRPTNCHVCRYWDGVVQRRSACRDALPGSKSSFGDRTSGQAIA